MWSPRQVTHLPPHLCGIFYFPWHRHQIEGTDGFQCLLRKTQIVTISNAESQYTATRASIVHHTFEAVAGSWGSVCAPAVRFLLSLSRHALGLLYSFIVELFVITDLILSSYDLLLLNTSLNTAFVSGQFILRCRGLFIHTLLSYSFSVVLILCS